jgi:hypothetical protein
LLFEAATRLTLYFGLLWCKAGDDVYKLSLAMNILVGRFDQPEYVKDHLELLFDTLQGKFDFFETKEDIKVTCSKCNLIRQTAGFSNPMQK